MLRLHRLYFNAVYSTIVSHLGIESTLASCTYPDMFMEFQFEDIVFGILPRVGAELLDAFGCRPNNSSNAYANIGGNFNFQVSYVVSLNIHSFKGT